MNTYIALGAARWASALRRLPRSHPCRPVGPWEIQRPGLTISRGRCGRNSWPGARAVAASVSPARAALPSRIPLFVREGRGCLAKTNSSAV